VSAPTVRELGRFFLWLGSAGFGGPIALVGYMEREFVERRAWVGHQEFKDGLAFAQLAPGPLAAQLAIYLGWFCGGLRGATIAGLAFVGPSFVMVLALSAFYLRFGGLPWLQGIFYGIGAAVIAIIARSAVKLVRSSVGRDALLGGLFLVSGATTAWTESEPVWLFVLAGVVTLLVKAPPRLSGRNLPVLALPLGLSVVSFGTLWTLFAYFASAGLFIFGSGLAIVPFLHGGVVQRFGWLTERQFLDAVAIAMVTPGPVVITVAFIGYIVAGLLGATAAALGVFAPVYVITILLAPSYHRIKSNAQVRTFVEGVTAAAVGAIAGAAIVLGRRAILDIPTALIGAGTLAILLWTKKIPEPLVILAAGIVGLAVRAIAGQ
jgi:chromate transporter